MKLLKFFCITLLSFTSFLSCLSSASPSIWQYDDSTLTSVRWFPSNPIGGPYFFGFEWPNVVGTGAFKYELKQFNNYYIWEHYGNYSSISCLKVETCNTNEWIGIDNNPNTSKIVSENGVLYQLHNDSQIFAYGGSPAQWRRIDNNGQTKNIVMAHGILYQRHKSNNIFRYDHIACANKSWPDGNCWIRIDANPKTVEIDVWQLYRTSGSAGPTDSVLIQYHP